MDPVRKFIPKSIKCGGCSQIIHFSVDDLVEVTRRVGSSPDLRDQPFCADLKHVCTCGRSHAQVVFVSTDEGKRLLDDMERRKQQTTLQVVASEG